jgi:hypothetical protein
MSGHSCCRIGARTNAYACCTPPTFPLQSAVCVRLGKSRRREQRLKRVQRVRTARPRTDTYIVCLGFADRVSAWPGRQHVQADESPHSIVVRFWSAHSRAFQSNRRRMQWTFRAACSVRVRRGGAEAHAVYMQVDSTYHKAFSLSALQKKDAPSRE